MKGHPLIVCKVGVKNLSKNLSRDPDKYGKHFTNRGNKIFLESTDEIGITPVSYDEIGYSNILKKYVSVTSNKIQKISGTKIREAIIKNSKLPDWYMRKSIQITHKKFHFIVQIII